MENSLSSLPFMPPSTFYLEFLSDGTLVDGLDYDNLDKARDVAFDLSEELGRQVAIMRQLNGKSFVEEVVG